MDILDRLLGHDAWTTRQLLVACRDLPDDLLDRPFEFGQGTLRRTFVHLIDNMEIWTDLICQQPQRAAISPAHRAITMTHLIERLDAVAPEFDVIARELRDTGRLDNYFVDVLDQPPRRKTFGGAIAHLITHSMHHRAQILMMLDILGIEHAIEGDALSWERLQRGGWDVDDTICPLQK